MDAWDAEHDPEAIPSPRLLLCRDLSVTASAPPSPLEWRDPLGLRGCGFFRIADGLIRFQRGYWDRLSFLRQHGLPIPDGG